jgi:hypothetical protein
MGTRSLTIINDEYNDEICVLYRQFDGYVEGHGKDLVNYLKDTVIVNGISCGNIRQDFNGMNCLAASLVAHFKTDTGGFYLYPAGTRDCGEEYIYTVYTNDKKSVSIDVDDCYSKEIHTILLNGNETVEYHQLIEGEVWN